MILQTDDDSPSSSQRLIQPGDLVVVYERHDSMKSVYVTPGENFGNRYGNFKHKAGASMPHVPLIRGHQQCDCKLLVGLGWKAFWQPCASSWPECTRLGILTGSHTRAMDTSTQAQDTDLVCSRHQHGLHISGAQTRLYRFVPTAHSSQTRTLSRVH